ncbi:MAG: hypothetical protein RSB23_01430 [Alistipes sp.]
MKKLFLLFLVTLTLTACDKEEGETYYDEIGYHGTLTVIPLAGGEPYTDTNIFFSLAEENNNTLTLYMNATRFVPQMPRLNMIVPGITYRATSTIVSLLGDNIIPWHDNVPMDRYLITNLSGDVNNTHLNISFTCMGYRVTYIGTEITY